MLLAPDGGPLLLPELLWRPTAASGERFGHPVELVVVHRWGVRYLGEQQEASAFQGVVNFFGNPSNGASAHVVFPGSARPGVAAQMVSWHEYAWAQAAFNPVADEFESADACWTLISANSLRVADEPGLHQLALMVAQRLRERGLPRVWSSRMGFCRHADLGVAGGGHTSCPTTNLALWRRFVGMVQRVEPLQLQAHWGR